MRAAQQHWLPLTSRIAAALIGGYAFTWGFTSLVVAGNLATGGDYDEGLLLAYLLAFLIFLGAFLFAFSAKRLALVWFVLAGGALAMTVLASAITPPPGAVH